MNIYIISHCLWNLLFHLNSKKYMIKYMNLSLLHIFFFTVFSVFDLLFLGLLFSCLLFSCLLFSGFCFHANSEYHNIFFLNWLISSIKFILQLLNCQNKGIWIIILFIFCGTTSYMSGFIFYF